MNLFSLKIKKKRMKNIKNKKIINNINDINVKLDPHWITGFVDGEGCFSVRVRKRESHNTGWIIQPSFTIKLHKRDKKLLEEVRLFFNKVGRIRITERFVYYSVFSYDELSKKIIPHFEKYPLITKKQSDFLFFKSIVDIINKKEHLNKEGLIQIVNLKASLNKGLSLEHKNSFKGVVPIKRHTVTLPEKIDYSWFAGFFSGEGCFFIDIFKSKTCKLGYSVALRVIVEQHSRDELLISSLITSLGCGYIFKYSTKNAISYRVTKFKDIYYKIIPLFTKHNIEGIKALDFQDFCEIAKLMHNKAHLNIEGLERIKLIKSRMNKVRYL